MDILTTDRKFLYALQHRFQEAKHIASVLPDLNKVYNLDACRYLRLFPDESVDILFTDEPYAVFKKDKPGYSTDWEWDGNLTIDMEGMVSVDSAYAPRLPTHLQNEWVFEVARVLKPNGILVNFGHVEYTGTFRDICKFAGLTWKASGPWIKTGGMPNLAKSNFRSGHEHFFVASKGPMKLNYLQEQEMLNYLMETECPVCGERFPVSFSTEYTHPDWLNHWYEASRMNPKKKSGHPTEKPEWLIHKLLTIVGGKDPQGKLVVDPYCGSGTTLAEATKMGMLWSGNDYDPQWSKYAQERAESIVTFV